MPNTFVLIATATVGAAAEGKRAADWPALERGSAAARVCAARGIQRPSHLPVGADDHGRRATDAGGAADAARARSSV